MYIKKIKFKDFNDNEREQDFYFNLRKDELAKLSAKYGQNFENNVRTMAMNDDKAGLYKLFEDLIKSSYGQKSEDGLHFRKSDQIWDDFYDSPAYEALFMEIMSDTDAAISFFKGIMPKDIAEKVEEELEKATPKS
jgi:hypothetical protein|nr:MAG TPA: hypothetical protein [Caudoviricetes sp.]DAS21296.1 MAG TPA: hypothetical protein [Caudoviricetes sp.]